MYGRPVPTAPPPTEAPVSGCASQGSKGACLRRAVEIDGPKCLWKGSKKRGKCVDKAPVVCSNISKKKKCKKAKECQFLNKRCVAQRVVSLQ